MIQIPARRPRAQREAQGDLRLLEPQEPFPGLEGPVLWARIDRRVHGYRVTQDAVHRPIALCRALWPLAVESFERHVLYDEPPVGVLCPECAAADTESQAAGR